MSYENVWTLIAQKTFNIVAGALLTQITILIGIHCKFCQRKLLLASQFPLCALTDQPICNLPCLHVQGISILGRSQVTRMLQAS